MKLLTTILVLLVFAFSALGQTATTPPNYFVTIGTEISPYSTPPNYAATTGVGVRISGNWWNVNTLVMNPLQASVRVGAGYAAVHNGNTMLIILSDAGITTQTAGSLPIPTTVTLGNVGGGFLLSYNLQGIIKRLQDKGLNVNFGMRIAAITATSVEPTFMFTIRKTL
jgi:hypothetical protein